MEFSPKFKNLLSRYKLKDHLSRLNGVLGKAGKKLIGILSPKKRKKTKEAEEANVTEEAKETKVAEEAKVAEKALNELKKTNKIDLKKLPKNIDDLSQNINKSNNTIDTINMLNNDINTNKQAGFGKWCYGNLYILEKKFDNNELSKRNLLWMYKKDKVDDCYIYGDNERASILLAYYQLNIMIGNSSPSLSLTNDEAEFLKSDRNRQLIPRFRKSFLRTSKIWKIAKSRRN